MHWNSFKLSGFLIWLCIALAKGDNSTAGTGIRCKQCSHVAETEACTTEVRCYPDEICSTEEYVSPDGNVLYDMDCKQASVCAAGGYTVTELTTQGRSAPLPLGRRQTGLAAHTCLQCCDSDLCNAQLCGGTVVTEPKLKCLACSNIDNPKDCTNEVECETDEICVTERHVTADGHTYYAMGCSKETVCEANGYTGSHVNGSRSNLLPVGKHQSSAAECFECCGSELCNGNLCEKKVVTEGRVHCLECTQVAKPEDCLNEVMCYPDESCFTEYFITSQGHAFYDLGCKAKTVCTKGSYNVKAVNAPLVGRKREHEVAAHVCEECCDSGLCNRHLCGGAVVDKLLCAKCTDAINATFCDELEQCTDTEVCFIQQKITDQFHVHYDAGCMHSLRCLEVEAQIQQGTCFECCNTSYCNTQCHMVTAQPTSSTITTSTTSTTTVQASTTETKTSTKGSTTPVKQTTTVQPVTQAVTTSPQTKSSTTTEAPSTAKPSTTNHVHTYKHTVTSSTKATTHRHTQSTTVQPSTHNPHTHQHTQSTTVQPSTHSPHTHQHQSTRAPATTTVPPCPRFPQLSSVTINHEAQALLNIGCNDRDEILFLIDRSHMVSKYDEHEFISFVKAFANTLNIGADATHLGVAIYNRNYLQSVSLTQPQKIQLINYQLTNLTKTVHTAGTADLSNAIAHAINGIIPRRHRGRRQIVILSRDDITNIDSVIQEVQKAHSEKIIIDFIGVGNFSGYGNKIYSVADRPKGVILLDTINELHALAEDLILRRCKHQKTIGAIHTPCGGPDILKHIGCRGKTDVTFIVDTSDSLDNDDVTGVGHFLYNLVDHMDVGASATVVGLMTFNNYVTQLANISTFQPKQHLVNVIRQRLVLHPRTEGETNTYLALDAARNSFYKSRQGSEKYVVLFTDGGSNHKMRTIASALELQRHNVTVIVVGVGSDVDVKEELIIASDPDVNHLVNLKNANDLDTYWNYLNAVRCKD